MFVKYIDDYKQIHKSKKYGTSGVAIVDRLVKTMGDDVESLLDYGAGQCEVAHFVRKLTGIQTTAYDPAVEWRSVRPRGKFDVVLCTDVLEHVPEEELKSVLEDIFQYTKNYAVLGINMTEAIEILPCGDNAHCTIKPKEWWFERISEVFPLVRELPYYQTKDKVAYQCYKDY